MENTPLISVIVPCYNQAQYLDECLQSVLDQTYQNWECIIVNDGSPDNTEDIAKQWTDKDARFKYLYKENGGLSSTRNAGIEKAKGEWIQFLDCDDKIADTKFEVSSMYFPNYDLIISNYIYFSDKFNNQGYPDDFDSKIFNFEDILTEWDAKIIIPIHCALFKRALISESFNESLKAKEDWVFWISFFKQKPKVYYSHKPLAFYRSNVASLTKNHSLMNEQELNAHFYLYEHLNTHEKDFFFKKRLFLKSNNLYKLQEEFEKLRIKSAFLQSEIEKLRNSRRYKIGNIIANIFEIVTFKK